MQKPSSDSAAKPNALFLSPEPFFPMIGGGALRSASLFEYLIQNYSVDVITFRQPGAPDPRDFFPPGAAREVHVIELPFHSRSATARAVRNLKRAAANRPPLLDRFSGFEGEIAGLIGDRRYELGVLEHFWTAPYVTQLRHSCRRLWLDLHNVESEWHASMARSGSHLTRALHRRFASDYRRLEHDLLPRFDCVLATSAADAERAGTRCVIYPNALPEIERPAKPDRNEIIFTGNLEYEPNISAIRYFKFEIWPALGRRWAGFTWAIAGKNADAIREIVRGDASIHLIGPMENAVERIAQAKVAIVPLLAGSGTRVKILEAWAAATPVVSTSIGAEGLDCQSGKHLLIADTPSDFAEAVSSLLADSEVRAKIGNAGRELYEQNYTWKRAWSVLDSQ